MSKYSMKRILKIIFKYSSLDNSCKRISTQSNQEASTLGTVKDSWPEQRGVPTDGEGGHEV